MLNLRKLKKMPLGIQDFTKIREDGYFYVDKTEYLARLISTGAIYFLSRPRRFGKTLTISTLEALYQNKRELFKGLAIDRYWDEPEFKRMFKPSPVIRLNMNRTVTSGGVEQLEASMYELVREIAEHYEIKLPSPSPHISFGSLISSLRDKKGERAVVLVDEYDKPILDSVDDREQANAFRGVLRSFYEQIKGQEQYINFIFLTGISKFSKTGIFSTLNNLTDISMDDPYATMLGYTEQELLENFSDHIGEAAADFDISRDELIVKMRDEYNGFSFNAKSRVYNPYSIMSFLRNHKFKNYWYETGSPSFIAKYLAKRKLTVEQFRGMDVSENFASVVEIDAAEPASFLYQAGYLTLRPGIGDMYRLDYPNREVLDSMSAMITYNIFGSMSVTNESQANLKRALYVGNTEKVVAEFNRLLAAIPYDDYIGSARQAVAYLDIDNAVDPGEWLFRSTLLSFLYGAELNVIAESHSSRGRADIVIKYPPNVWILELKMADDADGAKLAAEAALVQIKNRGYAEPYERPILLGLAVDRSIRQISGVSAG